MALKKIGALLLGLRQPSLAAEMEKGLGLRGGDTQGATVGLRVGSLPEGGRDIPWLLLGLHRAMGTLI